MSEKTPTPSDGTDKVISIVCVVAGVAAMMVLNQTTAGKVPGGAVGGAIGGALGGLLGAGLCALRRK